jgi:MFS superfamily sulfate permease-like transporter
MSFGLGMLTIAILVLWPKFAKGKLEYLPAPLLAILAATIVAALGSLPVQYVSIPDNLFTEWKPTQFNLGVILGSPALLGLAIQLGMIASAESLLCAAAVDQMHDGPRANMDRELTAQGLGNMVCGFLGTLPLTGVIVRSSANVHAGGKTRGSTILHGIWLLLFIVMLPGILELIPTSALAGLLVYTGGKLVNLKTAKLIYRLGRSELVIYLTTVGVIFFVDLLTGILVGLMMASLKLLKSLSHLSVKVESHSENRKVILIMGGAATFLRLPKLAAALANVPSGSEVVIEAQDLYRIDYACQEHFKAWRRRYERHGGKVEVGELF